MALLDYSDFDPTKPLRGNQKCTIPGKARFKIQSANKKTGKKGDYYAVTFEVIAHEVPEAVGQEYFQILPLSGTAAKGTLQLALASQILTEKKLQESALTGKGGIEIELGAAEDAIVCGEITKGEWQGKDTYKIWDFYGEWEPEAKGFPLPDDAEVKDEDVTGVPVVEEDAPADDDDNEIPF